MIFNVKYHVLNKFTQYSARFNQFYTRFFLIIDADDFFLAFETNCTEFRQALFPRERDLYIYTNPMVMYELMRISHTCPWTSRKFYYFRTPENAYM